MNRFYHPGNYIKVDETCSHFGNLQHREELGDAQKGAGGFFMQVFLLESMQQVGENVQHRHDKPPVQSHIGNRATTESLCVNIVLKEKDLMSALLNIVQYWTTKDA